MSGTVMERNNQQQDRPKLPIAGGDSPTYYVGIGASAGGLEALQSFFSNMAGESGAAFIIVQHLSSGFKSVMAQLLARHTTMPVTTVEDGETVKANCVYLIPPGKNMMIAEGRLFLADQMPEKSLNFPIDIFLKALAEDAQRQAIGIILSGTGSDGSRALKVIKESGGLVIVQEPTNAKFDGMPVSAVDTGMADMILPAEKMPAQLLRYMDHPYVEGDQRSLKQALENNDIAIREIFRLLQKSNEVDFSHYKQTTIARRIERRMRIKQISDVNGYLTLLKENNQELDLLAKDMLIGVTRFFRDKDPFNYLSKNILPELIGRLLPGDEFRAWIIGCSSGEETYSLAILVQEAVRKLGFDGEVKIFATDVDRGAISEASLGNYGFDIEADVGSYYLEKYFEKKDDSYKVRQVLRKLAIFAVHNAISDPPFSNMDLVLCRNTLIYFQQTAQLRVLSSIHFSLKNLFT